MLAALLGSFALAGAPVAALPAPRPVAEPIDIAAQFKDFSTRKGGRGTAVELPCRQLAEALMLCFVREDGHSYITSQDLKDWKLDLAGLELAAKKEAEAGFVEGRPGALTVEGMTGTYWLSAEGDGLDAAGLLLPERLAAIAGAEPVVAVPCAGVLLFWVPGDADFDKVMAVGVRQMNEACEHSVSNRVYRWKDNRWVVWGEAKANLEPSRGLSP